MQNRKKDATSFRLSPVALGLIKKVADKKGISQAAVIEQSVREFAERAGVTPDA